MNAMIMAAGKGPRVRPVTQPSPNPMIHTLHKPVPAFLFDLLPQHGFDKTVLRFSYLAGLL